MQVYKREAVNQFWVGYIEYSAKALVAGTIIGSLITRPSAILKSPLLPLFAGIGGGVALSECAESFNKL